ncbi:MULTISPECIES: carboxymuconolactone decarboxylase family protein [Pseudomonas]|uniref:carboxymuconolactone decarboxylase family protein n=1 Tax=Pseudomonas TaxID=286 RepID=UPI0007DBF441|nr:MULTISPECIES: peroxidase-related enzyme [Pseudomonas]QNV67750.1 peroxidase-related enzyme [Pseudomonas sp. CFA]AVD95510.1 alkylhydroperoxidase [Pseudomonas sp. SWI36]MBX6688466.1 peroxidase-related enzyme [Pseudomonas sp. USTB-Z]MCX2813361.1 peroxidase-related enzyme [Pseudomonas sp. DCB_E]MCX9140743.1 peroxidase-related enzyme [Pseudomonas sp. DCB_Q]
MTRITALSLDQAPTGSRAALEGIQKGLGFIPNAFRTLAHAPVALNGYLGLAQALGKSSLSAAEREVVALATSEINGCDYCLAAHTFFGGKAGLNDEAVSQARAGTLSAVAALAQQITARRGQLSDEQIAAAREAGLTDSKIVEVVAQVTLLTLTNYLNNIAATDIDFPPSAN